MAQTAATACPLPYPGRFEAAQKFQQSSAAGAALNKDETKLLLYALQQQAKHGPCKDPKPWAWNVVESAKWSSWKQLGTLSSVEAMRLFVKVVDDEQPDWWARSHEARPQPSSKPPVAATAAAPAPAATATAPSPPAAPTENGHVPGASSSLEEAGQPGEWFPVETSGPKRPPPRYEHAVAVIGSSMYMVGGNCSGRFLNDVWRLDLARLAWTLLLPHHPPTPPPQAPNSRSRQRRKAAAREPAAASGSGEEEPLKPEPVLPPVAGHTLLPWQDTLLCIGGHTKAHSSKPSMAVYQLDIKTLQWSVLQPSGLAPPARGSHSATLVGSRLFIYGGEDAQRQPHANIAILHLGDLAWEQVELDEDDAQPAARSAHTATCIQERWVVIFGGGSAAHCFNDVWALDTQRLRWQQLNVAGPSPSPRAGHAAAVLDDVWYTVGGGNNVAGCTDAIALDLRQVPEGDLVWVHVAELPRHGPLASEGLSLHALPSQHALLAWGGYNGQYHNHLHCFKPEHTRQLFDSAHALSFGFFPSPCLTQTFLNMATRQASRLLLGTGVTTQDFIITCSGGTRQQEAATGTVAGAAQAAQLLVEAAVEPVKAAAAAVGITGDPRIPAALPPSSPSAQQSAGPELARPSPFAQVALQQAPAATCVAKAAAKPEAKQLDRRIEGALGEVEAARREAATAKEAAGHELALMRRQLASAQSAHAAAAREVEGLKAELAAEQAKKFEMEVQRSEMQRRLQHTDDLQKELDSYRRMMSDAQAKGKSNGGLWGYISGAT
ncbi:hypothetical protein WJX74_000823 [Apatococcus lobatus]|uniref:ACB domain-containing protein n=1 Tax=Apatococcus lobatus TaxID=904363 RepID=A0AAW1SFA9_9CHLO